MGGSEALTVALGGLGYMIIYKYHVFVLLVLFNFNDSLVPVASCLMCSWWEGGVAVGL